MWMVDWSPVVRSSVIKPYLTNSFLSGPFHPVSQCKVGTPVALGMCTEHFGVPATPIGAKSYLSASLLLQGHQRTDRRSLPHRNLLSPVGAKLPLNGPFVSPFTCLSVNIDPLHLHPRFPPRRATNTKNPTFFLFRFHSYSFRPAP
jgi:hypothetical protein